MAKYGPKLQCHIEYYRSIHNAIRVFHLCPHLVQFPRYRGLLLKNRKFFIRHVYLVPQLGRSHWNVIKVFGIRKLDSQATVWW